MDTAMFIFHHRFDDCTGDLAVVFCNQAGNAKSVTSCSPLSSINRFHGVFRKVTEYGKLLRRPRQEDGGNSMLSISELLVWIKRDALMDEPPITEIHLMSVGL